MSYLVDSDWMIDGLSGRQETLAFLEGRRDEGLGVSVVTLGELYEGAYGSPEQEAHLASLERFLALFTVVPLSDATMQHFGRLRARLRQQGNLIPDFDLLIAATALDYDLVLVTRNRRHFERIPDLQLY
ncbi:MAG TPA: type II toxin-antitoxin system VapC family toxin [Chloroflexota bacterium]